MTLGISLIILIVGAIVYLAINRFSLASVAEIARLMFVVGLLAFLLK